MSVGRGGVAAGSFGLPVENRIISTNPSAEAGLSNNLSTHEWEMHPFCQMDSWSYSFLSLCVRLCGTVRSVLWPQNEVGLLSL